MAYFTVVLVGVSLFLLGYFFYGSYTERNSFNEGDGDWYWWCAITTYAFAGIYVLCICCYWKDLKLSVNILEVAADYLNDTKRIVLVPFAYFCVWCIIFWIWVYGFFNVASISTDNEITVTSVLL